MPNPAKRPHYRNIPDRKRCQARVGTGNYYRWSKRCHKRHTGTAWGRFCRKHWLEWLRSKIKEGLR